MTAIAKHHFVQGVLDIGLVFISVQIGTDVTVGRIKSKLPQVQTVIFGDNDYGGGAAQWTAIFLGAHMEQELIPGFLVTIPPSNHTGQLIGQPTKTTIVLPQHFQRIGFIIGIDRRIETGLPDNLGTLIDQRVIEIVE